MGNTARKAVDEMPPEALEMLEQEQEQDRKMAEEEQKRAKYLSNSAGAHLQEFINGIADSVNTDATRTGFDALDEALDGGLYEGLITIGAISSLGKTSFCLQMADQIAAAGGDALYFSFEQSRTELMSKSISRHTLMLCQERKLNTSNAKTARGITAGKRYANYSALERKLIDDAIAAYDEYAGHVYIYEGEGEVGVGEIGARIEEHVRYTGNKPAIVIVDYMQLLATFDPRASDKQNMDKAVLELKRLSRKHKIPIISISSYNRQNYKAEANFAALKESGLIEYSSDCVIGLQLAGTGESGFNDTREKAKDPRSIELLILKNRQGQVGQKLLLSYYPRFNYFRMESKPKEA